jgi:hypothetical protein
MEILNRIVAIDLNPLSVLTTRINYFIHISNLLGRKREALVIPVYLGDAAAIPDRLSLEGVECLKLDPRGRGGAKSHSGLFLNFRNFA